MDGLSYLFACSGRVRSGYRGLHERGGIKIKNIREVVQMIVEELIEEGKPIPKPQTRDVRVFTEQKVMVTV
ncbi:hypothetical protein C5S29_12405 [ANME-1 cluster archaeon GoMg3.2]|nr:hypothetical protein [ANME-1 cluster archaeon GoMg3.2]